MKEKSSDPIPGGWSNTTGPSSPATSAKASAISGALTVGAKISRQSSLAVAPKPAATPAAIRASPCSICPATSREKNRAVPEIVAVCGITL